MVKNDIAQYKKVTYHKYHNKNVSRGYLARAEQQLKAIETVNNTRG